MARKLIAITFDTLTYSKRLREAGVPKDQADAHAGAALYLFRAVSPGTVVLQASEAKSDLPAHPVDLTAAVDRMIWQLTLRVGGIVAAFAVLAVPIVWGFTKATPPI